MALSNGEVELFMNKMRSLKVSTHTVVAIAINVESSLQRKAKEYWAILLLL